MNRPAPTNQQIGAALDAVRIIGGIIKDLSPVPSGELYASLMGAGIDLNNYNSIIDLLKRAEVIKVESHLITWIAKEAKE